MRGFIINTKGPMQYYGMGEHQRTFYHQNVRVMQKQKMLVLVVHDSPMVLRSILLVLRRYGYIAFGVLSFREARALVSQVSFFKFIDVVITDMVMEFPDDVKAWSDVELDFFSSYDRFFDDKKIYYEGGGELIRLIRKFEESNVNLKVKDKYVIAISSHERADYAYGNGADTFMSEVSKDLDTSFLRSFQKKQEQERFGGKKGFFSFFSKVLYFVEYQGFFSFYDFYGREISCRQFYFEKQDLNKFDPYHYITLHTSKDGKTYYINSEFIAAFSKNRNNRYLYVTNGIIRLESNKINKNLCIDEYRHRSLMDSVRESEDLMHWMEMPDHDSIVKFIIKKTKIRSSDLERLNVNFL